MKQVQKATPLQAQILAVNTLREHCKQIISYEVEKMQPLIGKDPFKVDGSFKQKYQFPRLVIEKKKISAFGFDWWINTHYYHKLQYGKYELTVITTVSGGGYDKNGVNCNHSQQKQLIDLYEYENNIITKRAAMDLSFLDVVYSEDKILQAAEVVKQKEKEYETALNSIPYYFADTLYIRRLR